MKNIAEKIRPKQTKNASIYLTIRGMKNSKGKIMIALFDSEHGFPNRPVQRKTISIAPDLTAKIEFDQLSSKFYAISAFHSETGHSSLKTNFLGIPQERYGFSNNKFGIFGKIPDFEQVKFKVSSTTQLEIILRDITEVI